MKIKGHRLEISGVRGGLIASCSCESAEAIYRPAGRQHGVWMSWERDKIRRAHQGHIEQIKGKG